MGFSVMFWNIENFGKHVEDTERHTERVEAVATHIRNLPTESKPDLLCFCEIKDKVSLRSLLTDEFKCYDFAATDSKGVIELVTGWKQDTFKQVIFTQRRMFQPTESLRPGALASVNFEGTFFNFLFLHADSGTDCRSYENRQEILGKIFTLKDTLDEISGGDHQAKFVVMGDLNTMGRKKCAYRRDVSAEEEIEALERRAEANGMRMLQKDYENTWRGKPRGSDTIQESNLDHVLATPNVSFESFGTEAEVSVSGWNRLEGNAQETFIEDVSDHCSLFCRVIYSPSDLS